MLVHSPPGAHVVVAATLGLGALVQPRPNGLSISMNEARPVMVFRLGMNKEISAAIDLIQANRALGLERLRALAEVGNQSAIVYLGLYLSEEPATCAEAERWLKQAAQFESPDAAWNLAMIERERGNELQMRVWIDRAAEFGEPDAIEIKAAGYNLDTFFAALR
jgi:TPR repeat protein